MCLGSLGKVVGRKVNYPAWDLGGVDAPKIDANAAGANADVNAHASAVSLKDHNSATWIASTKGFNVG